MYSCLLVGALTASSSRYSYRSWEFERVESYDPFDTSGSSILYHIYNNIVVKVGSIVSEYSSWCTDKIRNFIDNFNCIMYLSIQILCGFKYSSVATWSYYWVFIITMLGIAAIFSYLNISRFINVLLYDVYSNSMELWFFLQFSKHNQLHSSYLYLYVTLDPFLYLGRVSLRSFDINCFSDLSFYCALLNLSYPYLWLSLSQVYTDVYVIGVLYVLNVKVFHKYLGFVYMSSALDCLSPRRVQDIAIHLVDGFWLRQISSIALAFSLGQSLSEIFYLYLFRSLCSYYKVFIFTDLVEYMRHTMCFFLLPYSFFFFEILGVLFKFAQGCSGIYIMLDCDAYKSYRNVKVSLLVAHYIVTYSQSYDIILPLCSYVGTYSFHIDYYGNLGVYVPITRQSVLFSISQSFGVLGMVLEYTNVYLYTSMLSVSLCSILLASKLYYSYILVYWMLFCDYIINAVHVGLQGLLVSALSCFVCAVRIYVISLPLVFSYSCYKSCNYVDISTYFLTGSYCRVSAFMSRHRAIVGVVYSL